jgi:hypothetical protein
MPFETHPLLDHPNDTSTIWRYLDFTKFVDMLNSRMLYFCNLCQLPDPYEGAFPPANSRVWTESITRQATMPPDQIPGLVQRLLGALGGSRRFMYVNCWHLSEYESAAMWRVYLNTVEGVAIKTAIRYLVDSVHSAPHRIFIGAVAYRDYDTETIREGDIFSPVTHKRRMFEYEKEVRAIYWDLGEPRPPDRPQNITNADELDSVHGIRVPVDLSSLVQEVYVAPRSQAWFRDLVVAVMKTYGIDRPVIPSAVDRGPA